MAQEIKIYRAYIIYSTSGIYVYLSKASRYDE